MLNIVIRIVTSRL